MKTEKNKINFTSIIEKDILLFKDARDILTNLKEQGVGIWGVDRIFDKRAKELNKILKRIK